ncbi:MAG TPA: HAD family hydrolase [Solirubrobacteraceae bacterium]|nr:HAD family hydrolase [Solirubrobacteraceae bacterium]
MTLDALGTLLALRPPAPLLAAGLRERGIEIGERQASAAIVAEIAFYRAHHDTAADADSLARLRVRCTQVLGDALLRAGVDGVSVLPPAELQDVLLGSLRFEPYEEVPAVLTALREAGHRLVVVSDWDVSLHETLRTTGLRDLVDGAISSAEAGASKPAPAIFEQARAIAGEDAPGGLHAGDSVEYDVAGAIAAGLRPVLVVRTGRVPTVPDGVEVIRSLIGLPALAA